METRNRNLDSQEYKFNIETYIKVIDIKNIKEIEYLCNENLIKKKKLIKRDDTCHFIRYYL